MPVLAAVVLGAAGLRCLGRERAERVFDARAEIAAAPFASGSAGVLVGCSDGPAASVPVVVALAFGAAALRDRRGAGPGASAPAAASCALVSLADVSAGVSGPGPTVAGGALVPTVVDALAAGLRDRLAGGVAGALVDVVAATSR
jgi:hypothetical protein